MKVFVAGATGVLGRELVPRLVARGHDVVGMDILDGVVRIYADASLPAPVIADVTSVEDTRDAVFVHAYLGVNGEPRSKFAAFAEVMDSPSAGDVDVALMKLCYADITAATDVQAVFDAYVSTMTEVEEAHPDVRLLYTTAPLTADRRWTSKIKAALGRDDQMGPADNVARERYNALIREKYAATGRLVDIAATESMGTEERSEDGNVYHVLNETLTFDRGHLNEAGSEAVAAELLTTVATNSPVL
jgi:NAD(P)-dependent dehydrogenase (short-subunit alcohol dehydrogenase family)